MKNVIGSLYVVFWSTILRAQYPVLLGLAVAKEAIRRYWFQAAFVWAVIYLGFIQ